VDVSEKGKGKRSITRGTRGEGEVGEEKKEKIVI